LLPTNESVFAANNQLSSAKRSCSSLRVQPGDRTSPFDHQRIQWISHSADRSSLPRPTLCLFTAQN